MAMYNKGLFGQSMAWVGCKSLELQCIVWAFHREG